MSSFVRSFGKSDAIARAAKPNMKPTVMSNLRGIFMITSPWGAPLLPVQHFYGVAPCTGTLTIESGTGNFQGAHGTLSLIAQGGPTIAGAAFGATTRLHSSLPRNCTVRVSPNAPGWSSARTPLGIKAMAVTASKDTIAPLRTVVSRVRRFCMFSPLRRLLQPNGMAPR